MKVVCHAYFHIVKYHRNMATREVYQVNQNTGQQSYGGYARFDEDGRFEGTYGGYGFRGMRNNANNRASRVQNVIATAGARQRRRARRAGL